MTQIVSVRAKVWNWAGPTVPPLSNICTNASVVMCSAMIPELIKSVVSAHLAGGRAAAVNEYARILPVINHENRQCGFRAAKAVFKEGGVIESELCRHPVEPLQPQARETLLNLVRDLDPVAWSWGR